MEINIIQMNFKNRSNYLFNDNLIVDINDFDSSQLEINYHLRVFLVLIFTTLNTSTKTPNHVSIERTDNDEDLFICFIYFFICFLMM